MKYILPAIMSLAAACSLSAAVENPLDSVDWTPPSWTSDAGKTAQENLIDLLNTLESAAAEQEELWFLELHFDSIGKLVEEYPPQTSQANSLIQAFTNVNAGAGLAPYLSGKRQIILAFDSSANGGTLSYAAINLPLNWHPEIEYPVYAWARGGGGNNYPADIVDVVYGGQVSGNEIAGAPSAVYKEGYTIQPGVLGKRGYTGEEEKDFIDAMEAFRARFETDARRYYFGGFSNGGKAVYNMAPRTMDRFNWAAVGMCAPAVRDTISEDHARGLLGTVIWMAVGANDGSWRPTTQAVKAILEDVGHPIEYYHEAPGVGHTWSWEFQDGMYKFIKQYDKPLEGPLPAAPTGLGTSSIKEDSLTLTWDAAQADAQIIVERKLASGEFGPIALLPKGATSYTDDNLTPNTEYEYRIFAYAPTGDSGYANLTVSTRKTAISLINVALDATVLGTSDSESVERLFDGNPSTEGDYRWSAQGYPQWVEIDLGQVYQIRRFQMYFFQSRDYRYKIETKVNASDSYTETISSPRTAPIAVATNDTKVEARYVKLTVTGSSAYTGDWVSIGELEVYAIDPSGELPVRMSAEALNGNMVRLHVAAEANVELDLVESEDLQTWTPIQQVSLEAEEETTVDVPVGQSSERYLRLQIAEE